MARVIHPHYDPILHEERKIDQKHSLNVVVNLIWFVVGVVLVLLAFRFILALFGANLANGFADFIFSTSQPLVAPFFGLFSYNPVYGVARFELYTLIAMLVYYIVALGLVRLVTIDRDL